VIQAGELLDLSNEKVIRTKLIQLLRNAKLKGLVAELSLEKQILKDVAEGNF